MALSINPTFTHRIIVVERTILSDAINALFKRIDLVIMLFQNSIGKGYTYVGSLAATVK